MKPGALNFEPDVDITAPAIGQAPSGVRWEKVDAPISGNTPAARNASATGAMAAAPKAAPRVKQLLHWFLEKNRLTLDEARILLEIPVNCVTGPWSKAESAGWIEGTGEFFTYKAGRRTIHREWHRLTADGRAVALELRRLGGAR